MKVSMVAKNRLPRPRKHRGIGLPPHLPLKETIFQECWLWVDTDGTLWVGQLAHKRVFELCLGYVWFFQEGNGLGYFEMTHAEWIDYMTWKHECEGRQRELDRYWERKGDDDEVYV